MRFISKNKIWLTSIASICLVAGATASETSRSNDEGAVTRAHLIGQLSSKDDSTRALARTRLLQLGPDVLGAVRRTQTETDQILKNYEMLVSGDSRWGRATANFFGEHKAALFLAEGLRVKNVDVKLYCVRELRKFRDSELEAIVPQVIKALEALVNSSSKCNFTGVGQLQ